MQSTDAKMRYGERGHSAFFNAVRDEVDALVATRGGPTQSPLVIAKLAILTPIALGAYAFALSGIGGWAVSLLAYLGFGATVLLLVMNVSHDAVHNTVFRSRRLNAATHWIIFNLTGIDARMWVRRHLGSHHAFPNTDGCDADIDENHLVRLSPYHRPHRLHRYQHLYAPFLYAIVQLHSIFFQDWVYLFKRRLANMRDWRATRLQMAEFGAGKLYHFAVALIIPMAVAPYAWWQILIAYFLMTNIISLIFVFALIGTHLAEETRFSKPDDTGAIPGRWAENNLAASLDWSPESRAWGLFVGGINAHAAHHLFPQMSHVHYQAISPIIERHAREFDVLYNKTTVTGMIASHFRFLKRMGRDETTVVKSPEIAENLRPAT